MKKLLTAVALIFWLPLFPQQKTTQSVPGELTNATIYYGYGAELNHTVKAALTNGLQEVIITDIATQVDVNTLQVGCPESVVLVSYRFQLRQPPPVIPKQPEVEKKYDTLKLLQKQQNSLYNETTILEDLLTRTTKVIESNVTNNPKKEISSSELIRLNDYYIEKVHGLKNSIFMAQLKKGDIEEKIAALNGRISEANRNTNNSTPTKPAGQIILQVMTKGVMTADFNLSYFTNSAGWIPTYDLRMKMIDNSFKLSYKASVTQTTGIDWKNVRLSLSTSNPNQGSTVPTITPWHLSLYVPVLYDNMKKVRNNVTTNKMQNMGASISQITATEEKDYKLANKEQETIEGSNVGAYTKLAESRLNTNFEIDLPYDIPSDGKAYSVSIKEEQIKASYKHYAVPRLDRDAFLVAEISEWENLDLMPGESNIIMDNVYLGKSFIDPNTTQDTLHLSLGRDKRIAIKRMLVKELAKSKVKGETKTENFSYEITVKNNKKQPVDIVLKDQYPVSQVKEVEVILDESSNAEVNEEMGTLNWKISLAAGESKKFGFRYTVRYPKDKVIHNLR
jgi:uncharacterized protein (TIGR02231 family)